MRKTTRVSPESKCSCRHPRTDPVEALAEKILGSIAITTATFNVVGGFAITDRMLKLFKGKMKTP